MRRTYSERKRKATGYVLINGSPYRDAEGSPHQRSCLHDAIINAAPRVGEKIDQSELYRQCSPRRVMDTTTEELEKCECVSSVMNIAPGLDIEREKMGPLRIILRINDGVYVCICSVYSNIFEHWTQHAFFYDSYFTTKVNSACHGAIIENRRYAPICVMEEKDRETKNKLKIMLRNFFQGMCIVKYVFKVTSRDFP